MSGERICFNAFNLGFAPHASELYPGVSMHNALWSTAFSGMIGPESYWYHHYLSDIGLKKAENEYKFNAGSKYGQTLGPVSGLNWEANTKAADYFWPSWYKITDANCSLRRKVNISGYKFEPDVALDVSGTDDITPDFTHDLQPLMDFMNRILPLNGINLQNEYIPQRFPDHNVFSELSYINSQSYYVFLFEAFTLVKSDGTKATDWVHNRSNYWGNYDYKGAFSDGYVPNPSKPDEPINKFVGNWNV
jgi:hypothetical protein